MTFPYFRFEMQVLRSRVRYRLTEKGFALAPVLIEIILWADGYENTAAPPDLIAAMRGNRKRFIASLRKR